MPGLRVCRFDFRFFLSHDPLKTRAEMIRLLGSENQEPLCRQLQLLRLPASSHNARAGVRIRSQEQVSELMGDGDVEQGRVESVGDRRDATFGMSDRVFRQSCSVARELARVLRRGGRLGICAWTPEGAVGRFFRAMGGYMPPPPPEFATPPLAWGTEDHVRRLFSNTGVELEFRRETVDFPPLESVEAEVEFATSKFGPLIMSRKFLEPQGRWPALLADLARQMEQREPSEYLVILGRK